MTGLTLARILVGAVPTPDRSPRRGAMPTPRRPAR